MTIAPEHIRSTLDAYRAAHPEDAGALDDIRALLDAGADVTDRREFRGHVTAGAVVLDAGDRVLLIHHRALDRWLLPGGHLEPQDDALLAAALRELAEETGVVDVAPIAEAPVHIDVHAIPANPAKGEPEHPHVDVRYAFRAASGVGSLQLDEVTDAAWRPVNALDAPLRGRVAALVERVR